VRIYLQQTKALAFSLFAISPLLFIYEFNISRYNQGQALEVRNAAEVYIKNFFEFLGLNQPWQLALVYVFFTFVVYFHARYNHKKLPKITYWFGFFIECIVYAAIFGTITRYITGFLISLQANQGLNSQEFWLQVWLAIAAGVYEEFLFRFFLAGSLLYLFRALLPVKIGIQVILAALVSSLLFSLFHYPSIEFVFWNSFIFRIVAGFILALLFVYRGLGVAVYTHALYDLFFLYRKL
jgi:membrane protease YdiL (CAAX protease family)